MPTLCLLVVGRAYILPDPYLSASHPTSTKPKSLKDEWNYLIEQNGPVLEGAVGGAVRLSLHAHFLLRYSASNSLVLRYLQSSNYY